jgi:very-short-patch-repair endonuclease
VRVRRAAISEAEVSIVGDYRTTSRLRTARDLGSGRDLVEAVIGIEMAVQARIARLDELAIFVANHPGMKGIKRLRRALSMAEPRSESPMETRLRLELLKARLPAPTVQADLYDTTGKFVARADLYYADRRLVIEYDGANHRDRLEADLRRQNALLMAGYHLLRFTAAELRTPGFAAAQVRIERSRLARIPG